MLEQLNLASIPIFLSFSTEIRISQISRTFSPLLFITCLFSSYKRLVSCLTEIPMPIPIEGDLCINREQKNRRPRPCENQNRRVVSHREGGLVKCVFRHRSNISRSTKRGTRNGFKIYILASRRGAARNHNFNSTEDTRLGWCVCPPAPSTVTFSTAPRAPSC